MVVNKKSLSGTLAIDIDGVLRKLHTSLLRVINRELGIKVSLKEMLVDGKFPKEWNKMALESMVVKNLKEIYLDSEAFEEEVLAVKLLRNYYNVVLVSAVKGKKEKEFTLEWLQKNGLPTENIAFLEDKGLVRADIIIDDYIPSLMAFIHGNPQSNAYLLSRLWNKNFKVPENVQRINSILSPFIVGEAHA